MNPHYHPDRAHLPNAEDKKKWQNGGREKELKEQGKLERFVAKWNSITSKWSQTTKKYD